jgi:predicted GIY-YIG superfamily endonuclease
VSHENFQQLYRMFDAQGSLLYVGISKSAISRMTQHASQQWWWRDVAKVQIESYACTRPEILVIEEHAIRSEKPVHNWPVRRHWSKPVTYAVPGPPYPIIVDDWIGSRLAASHGGVKWSDLCRQFVADTGVSLPNAIKREFYESCFDCALAINPDVAYLTSDNRLWGVELAAQRDAESAA